jgi:hypothetical protein
LTASSSGGTTNFEVDRQAAGFLAEANTNTLAVAQAAAPEARVVCVDNDPRQRRRVRPLLRRPRARRPGITPTDHGGRDEPEDSSIVVPFHAAVARKP